MFRIKTLTCLLIVTAVTGISAQNGTILNSRTLDLNSLNWNVANLNGSINTEIGNLPKMVLEGLVQQKILTDGDPISGFNSRNYRWVASETWSVYAEFETESNQLEAENIDLLLEGVDTIASVFLNNKLVGKCDNAHKQFRFGVKDNLVEGTNMLEFVFSPAPEYAAAKSAEYALDVPGEVYPRGYPFYNFIRKPASDFGWDWGPAFAPSGIYGSVRLESYNTAYLTGCSITQQHAEDGSVFVTFRASFQSPNYQETGTLMVESDDMQWTATQPVTFLDIGQSFQEIQVEIKDNYDLWWPVGFGAQTLYNFTVTYTPDESNSTSEEPGADESSLVRRLGIRIIELVQQPISDPAGFTFFFRVNGIPIFARGSNMVPLQIFHSQNSEAGYRQVLEDAVLANMNMIRVWGGGLYQQDIFYDLCDEMGLLVWQEAMFACAQYPINSDFLGSVQDEISYQAQRLGHHASLALWGGNNEVETSFTWFPESSSNTPLFVSNYMKLFVDTIRTELLKVDPNVNFVDSSPSKGVFSLDPYQKRWGNPSAVNAGDVHFYDYTSNCLSLDSYPRAKFVSEYGFQSFPSFSVYRKYTKQSDWSLMSNMSEFRQNHPDGNSELQNQLKFHFQQYASTAINPTLTTMLFQQWIYLTQLQQAMCYEAGITNWRRLKVAPDARTMGVLYWQLNDIWAGASWSGRDFGGHWKLLMYNLKRMFSPVLISGVYNVTVADSLSVYVTNDQPYKVSGTATVELISFAARGHDQPLVTLETDFEVDPLGSKVVNMTAIKSKLTNLTLTLQDAIVRLSMTASGDQNDFQAQTCLTTEDNPFSSVCTPAKGIRPSDGPSPITFESSQTVWLTEPMRAAIPTFPGVRTSNFRQLNDTVAAFQITSRNVAVGVQLDTDTVDGIFSDNNLLVLPWENRQLNFTGRKPFKVADLQRSITIMSLADTLTNGAPHGPYEIPTY